MVVSFKSFSNSVYRSVHHGARLLGVVNKPWRMEVYQQIYGSQVESVSFCGPSFRQWLYNVFQENSMVASWNETEVGPYGYAGVNAIHQNSLLVPCGY